MAAKYPVPTKEQFISLSCINVGVGPGGTTSMLACVFSLPMTFCQLNLIYFICSRVSIVNYIGETILDTYVTPTMPVTDYRSTTTGILAEHLNSGQRHRISVRCILLRQCNNI